jgi:hypothetical protein
MTALLKKSKSMRPLLLMTLLLCAACDQEATVCGSVVDTGEPVSGATVRIQTTENAATTDSRGLFSLQAVTRVNLEQASKVQMWTLTRPRFGEGRSRTGKKPIYAPVLVHRGIEDGMSGKCFMQRGRPVPEVG